MTEQSEDIYLPAKITYGLFAAGYVTGGLASIAGIIFAYISRGKDTGVDTHMTYLIQTFWISLVVAIVGIVLAFIGIGFLVLLGLFVWGIIRLVTGFILAIENKPISEVKYIGALAS